MELEKQNNFEEEWRKAFERASMPPSDELWGRIEAELEKEKKRPFIFFLKPSYMAAGLAATLLLVLGGILFYNTNTEPAIAQNNPTKAHNNENISSPTEGENLPSSVATSQENPSLALEIQQHNEEQKLPLAARLPEKSVVESAAEQTNALALANASEVSVSPIGSVNPIQGKKYRYLGSRYTMNRNKLAFDAEALEEVEKTSLASNDSKFWIGIQSGVAPYDPNMKLGNLNNIAYSAANDYAQLSNGSSSGGSYSVSRPQNTIKPGLAINNGMAFGFKVSTKWHVESGVRYLRGNSTLETNTYAFQNNGYVNTFLGNYLLQNSVKDYSMVEKSNTIVADASKFGNRYEYLMIPVQMAYEIGLTKKLGLNLLAGISTDIFLQNSILTDNGLVRSENNINSENRIYKPVNFSGLGGVRASYKLNRHWQANIGTSYQRALFSGMTSSVNLNMRPQMFGLNYGFNYRF